MAERNSCGTPTSCYQHFEAERQPRGRMHISYTQHLTPRPEVLSDDGIEGIIDLRNLEDRRHRKLESKPDAFLNLTYPTTDIKRGIERLNDRFSERTDTSALFLFEGLKGSGKLHLLPYVQNNDQMGRAGLKPAPSAPVGAYIQRGASPLQANALRPVVDRNCVAAKRGGKQRKTNDQSVGDELDSA